MIKWNIDKIKKYVEENTESKLISNKYENQNKELEFICKCGNSFKRTWKLFLRGSHSCKKCSWEKINKNRKYTIEYVRRFVNENSTSELISKKYAHCKEKLEFKCECGEKFLTITPGVRFADGDIGDQKRVMTPAAAKEIGSDYIVVGRPITAAEDPVAAYERCVAEFCD